MSTEAAAATDASTESEHEHTETETETETETVIGYRIMRRARVIETDDEIDDESEVRQDPWTSICGSPYLYRENGAKRMAELRAERGDVKEYKLVEVRESSGGERRTVDVGAIDDADDDADDESETDE